jgi:Uma2 family endonuclease
MLNSTQTAIIPPEELALPGNGLLWRMSVDTYHALVDAGTFASDEDVELIHGYVVKKMPKNPSHAKANQWLVMLIAQMIGMNQGWYFAVQDPITLEDSEPEPDLAIVRGTPDDHEGHPGPQDVGLAIEVADSSLDYDENVKEQLYAISGIVEYWIVNVRDKQIQVYTEPYRTEDRAGYRHQTNYVAGDAVPVILDGKEYGRIQVSDILS